MFTLSLQMTASQPVKLTLELLVSTNPRQIKEVEVTKGELVLVRVKKEKETALLGIAKKVEKHYDRKGYHRLYVRDEAYVLRPPVTLNGQILALARKEIYLWRVDKYISEIYEGKDTIVNKLREDAHLSIHAEWVEKLIPPYSFPSLSNYSFSAINV